MVTTNETLKYVNNFVWFQGTLRVPWLSFAKSRPLYALAVANFTCMSVYITLLTCLPQYFKHILHFDIKSVSAAVLPCAFRALNTWGLKLTVRSVSVWWPANLTVCAIKRYDCLVIITQSLHVYVELYPGYCFFPSDDCGQWTLQILFVASQERMSSIGCL